MRRCIASLAVAAAILLPAQTAVAQTNFSAVSQFSATQTVNYLPFTVTTGGLFSITTSGPSRIDPMIILFAGTSTNGAGLGAALAVNDDGAGAPPGSNICAVTCHSQINRILLAGDYTVALGMWELLESEARAGFNATQTNGRNDFCFSQGDFTTCNYDVTVSSIDGIAMGTVPEPSTVVLLAAGLMGLGGIARRRRSSTAA